MTCRMTYKKLYNLICVLSDKQLTGQRSSQTANVQEPTVSHTAAHKQSTLVDVVTPKDLLNQQANNNTDAEQNKTPQPTGQVSQTNTGDG